MSNEKQIDPMAACRLFVNSNPATIDEPLIREVFGDVVLTGMDQVAQAMGVAASTVRNTWRRDGMPGVAKRGTKKANQFPLAEIIVWELNRRLAATAGRGQNEDTKRKQSADARKAEIDAMRAERAFEMEQGKFLSVDVLRSQWNAGLAVLSNDIMAIPRDVKPALCAKCAKEGGPEIERRLRNALVRVSERSLEEVLPEGVNGHATKAISS